STRTTLNIESFMGVIMAIGVSVSNSVMLVTFARENWFDGMTTSKAATNGAASRLRPILMTACAMIVGMIPMALALEEGSQMQAPLARAVIGGLTMSTLSTLFILPPVFALVMGRGKPRTISLHPDDPTSRHFDPDGAVETPGSGNGHPVQAVGAPSPPAELLLDALSVSPVGEPP
ncbi:MAG TPA: efflux RND transporter permease subunit, partial [Isosphaeraceae bacterium]|nr:efflux RND transporter permease subunit [Isosphaeraceae bacterium]